MDLDAAESAGGGLHGYSRALADAVAKSQAVLADAIAQLDARNDPTTPEAINRRLAEAAAQTSMG